MFGHGIQLNIAIILSVIIANLAHGGSWVQEKNGYFVKLSINHMITDTEYNHKGEKIPYLGDNLILSDTYFRDINIYSYYEYGISDKVTLLSDFAFKSYTSKRTITTVYESYAELPSYRTRWTEWLNLKPHTKFLKYP